MVCSGSCGVMQEVVEEEAGTILKEVECEVVDMDMGQG